MNSYTSKIFLECAFPVLFSPIVKDVLLRFLFREMKADYYCRRFIGGCPLNPSFRGVEEIPGRAKKDGKIWQKNLLDDLPGGGGPQYEKKTKY